MGWRDWGSRDKVFPRGTSLSTWLGQVAGPSRAANWQYAAGHGTTRHRIIVQARSVIRITHDRHRRNNRTPGAPPLPPSEHVPEGDR